MCFWSMLVTLVLLGVSLLDKSLVVLIKNVYVGICPLLTLSDMVVLGREGVRKWILRGCSAESTRTNEGSDRETPDASTINRCWWKEPRGATLRPLSVLPSCRAAAFKLQGCKASATRLGSTPLPGRATGFLRTALTRWERSSFREDQI
jgi:hypothetical protein